MDDTHMWLESNKQFDCPRCNEGRGCGGGIIARMFGKKRYQLKLKRDPRVSLYQVVQLQIPDRIIIKASAIMYVLPLIGLLIGALMLHWVDVQTSASEIYSIVGGCLGLIVGLMFARSSSRRVLEQCSTEMLLLVPPHLNLADGVNKYSPG